MTEQRNHPIIEGYSHISVAVDRANKKLNDIRTGVLKPILTSSKKETEKIGGFFEGDQIVIAGRTGTGKTSKVIQMIDDFVNPSINPDFAENGIILFDSLEMIDFRNVLRMYSKEHELSVKQIMDTQQKMMQDMFDRIIQVSTKFRNHPIYFNSVSDNVREWKAKKRKIRKLFPKKKLITVYDHCRLATKEGEKTEEELITNLMKAGMVLKLEDDYINIFLSQMNRAIETASLRSDIGKALPVSSDLFGGDSIMQFADVVVASHRPGMYGLKTFDGIPTGKTDNPDSVDYLMIDVVLKQRDGWIGNILKRHNLAINKIEDYEI